MVSRRLFVTAWPLKLSTLKLLVFAGNIMKATTVTSELDVCNVKKNSRLALKIFITVNYLINLIIFHSEI